MTEPIIIDITHGSETTRQSGAKLLAFWCTLDLSLSRNGMPESGLDDAIRSGDCGIKQVSRTMTQAYAGSPDSGIWTQGRYTAPEGTLIKLFAEKTAWGHLSERGSVMIQASKYAPDTELWIDLTGEARANLHRAVVRGRFHILSFKELRAIGFFKLISEIRQRDFKSHNTEDLFHHRKHDNGFEAPKIAKPAQVVEKQEVSTKDGKSVQVAVVRKQRVIRRR